MANHPTCNALLVCDMAISDAETGKTTLVGIFETIHAPRFPAMVPWLVLYTKVSDVEGTIEFDGELIRLVDGRRVGTFRKAVTIASRVEAGEAVFKMPGLVFERPGRYEFRLSTGNRLVGIKSFQVVESAQDDT